jgi:hypothetical protein
VRMHPVHHGQPFACRASRCGKHPTASRTLTLAVGR